MINLFTIGLCYRIMKMNSKYNENISKQAESMASCTTEWI